MFRSCLFMVLFAVATPGCDEATPLAQSDKQFDEAIAQLDKTLASAQELNAMVDELAAKSKQLELSASAIAEASERPGLLEHQVEGSDVLTVGPPLREDRPADVVDPADFVRIEDAPPRLDTAELGKRFPRLSIGGVKLVYDPVDEWYHFTGNKAPRAIWIGSSGGKCYLGTSNRIIEHGGEQIVQDWVPDKEAWIDTDEKPWLPPHDEREAGETLAE